MKRKFIKTGTIGKALLTVATVGTIFVATPNAVQAADIDDAPKDNNVSVAKPAPEKPAPKSDDKPGPKDEKKPGDNKPGENKPEPAGPAQDENKPGPAGPQGPQGPAAPSEQVVEAPQDVQPVIEPVNVEEQPVVEPVIENQEPVPEQPVVEEPEQQVEEQPVIEDQNDDNDYELPLVPVEEIEQPSNEGSSDDSDCNAPVVETPVTEYNNLDEVNLQEPNTKLDEELDPVKLDPEPGNTNVTSNDADKLYPDSSFMREMYDACGDDFKNVAEAALDDPTPENISKVFKFYENVYGIEISVTSGVTLVNTDGTTINDVYAVELCGQDMTFFYVASVDEETGNIILTNYVNEGTCIGNYFGISQDELDELISEFGEDNLVVDNRELVPDESSCTQPDVSKIQLKTTGKEQGKDKVTPETYVNASGYTEMQYNYVLWDKNNKNIIASVEDGTLYFDMNAVREEGKGNKPAVKGCWKMLGEQGNTINVSTDKSYKSNKITATNFSLEFIANISEEDWSNFENAGFERNLVFSYDVSGVDKLDYVVDEMASGSIVRAKEIVDPDDDKPVKPDDDKPDKPNPDKPVGPGHDVKPDKPNPDKPVGPGHDVKPDKPNPDKPVGPGHDEKPDKPNPDKPVGPGHDVKPDKPGKPGDNKPGKDDNKPGHKPGKDDNKPGHKPGDGKPDHHKPGDGKPDKPVKPDPVDPDPIKPDPVDPDPVKPDPVKPNNNYSSSSSSSNSVVYDNSKFADLYLGKLVIVVDDTALQNQDMVNLLTRLMMALQCSDYPEFQLVFASQVTTDQLMQFDTVISLCDLTKDDDTIATALTNFATIAKDQEISKKFFNVFLYDYYETTINPTSDNILIERFEKDFTYESLYINKSTKVDEEFLKVIARAGNDFRSYGYVREEVFDQIEASPLK